MVAVAVEVVFFRLPKADDLNQYPTYTRKMRVPDTFMINCVLQHAEARPMYRQLVCLALLWSITDRVLAQSVNDN